MAELTECLGFFVPGNSSDNVTGKTASQCEILR